MNWLKQNWIAFLIIASMAVAVGLSQRAAHQAQNAGYISCVSASKRTTYESALGEALNLRVGKRGGPGDDESAGIYGGLGLALAAEVPGRASRGITDLTIDRTNPSASGSFKVMLTDEALARYEAGCAKRWRR